MALVGAIEAGGTKFVCAVARSHGETLAETTLPTTSPERTLAAVVEFFSSAEAQHGKIAAIGIGSFGPVDVKPHSPTWGRILATSKPGWSHTDMAGPLQARFGCPVAIDTDVNAAALAEARYGAGRGCDVVVYVTVGTGIGGGAVIAGQLLHGALHPEMGHLRVTRLPQDSFASVCPFHAECAEGLAGGPAIRARWGRALEDLPPGHEALGVIGNYLGQVAAAIKLMLSPERIVFGGGVMRNRALLPYIRSTAAELLNGYLHDGHVQALEHSIVPPGLGERSGLVGAIALGLASAAPASEQCSAR